MSKLEEYFCTIFIQNKTFECKSLLHQTDINKLLLCYIDGTITRRTLCSSQKIKTNKNEKN